MQIFSSESTKKALEGYLAGLEADCIIIDLEQPDENNQRSTAIGMKMAPMLAATNPNTPVIIVGWQTVEMYEKYPAWQGAIKFKNVVLRRLPVVKEDILSAIAEVKERLATG